MARIAELAVACMHPRIGPVLGIALGVLAIGAEPASAFSFHATVQSCRESVGRPIVKACMGPGYANEQERAAALAACRTKAAPSVRSCVQRAMIGALGWPKVEGVIEQCRQTIGRPAVNACMTAGGAGARAIPDLQRCQAQAAPQVRACVRRTLSQTG